VQPLLLVGASGTLGEAVRHACRLRSLAVATPSRAELDITDADAVVRTLQRVNPWAVINTAGYVRVDQGEGDVAACFAANTTGPVLLAHCCATVGIPLATFSSDLVFDGQRARPYLESDTPAPLSVYGCSKAEAERGVLRTMPAALIMRTSSFFGPWDRANFATRLVRDLGQGRRVAVASDVVMRATYVPDLAHATLDLLIDGATGIWHITNPDELTWEAFARTICHVVGIDPAGLNPTAAASMRWIAPRPAYSALGTERGELLPPLLDAIERWHRDRLR
jgi:dTDP-4-dehydrorhamnose reductase